MTKKKVKKNENEFEKLARLIKEEGEDIRGEVEGVRSEVEGVRGEMKAMEHRLDKKIDDGFATVNRRLDTLIQTQLDEHAHRIKKLETAVFK